MTRTRVFPFLVLLCLLVQAATAAAQQTGAIAGKVTDTSGAVLPGVTIEASANVLPTPRVTTSGANGEYRMPALPPGTYTVKFELTGMQTVSRQALVQLGQDTIADATLGVGVLTEAVTVTAATSLVERDSATIKSGVSSEQIAT
jgi:Carboxypeptidase regulatory-like domain